MALQAAGDKTVTPSSLRVVFMGTPDFAVPSLQALIEAGYRVAGVVTQPDRPQGRHMTLKPPPVKEAALLHGIPVLQPEKVRTPEFFEQLKAFAPDLIVTAAYGKILPLPILELPKYGCVNVHASLLPRYRGAAPIQWCVIDGEKETGVTIMQMDVGMDTGAILTQIKTEIPDDMTAGELTDKLAAEGARILSPTILDYSEGKILPRPQDESLATLIRPIEKEDARINWHLSAQAVHNKVRGCSPWPVAFTMYQGKRLKIYRTKPLTDPQKIESLRDFWNAAPGAMVLPEDKTALYVKCSPGFLEILELQTEGARRMTAKECAHNLKPCLL